jgi:ureidoglycolate hydrolase
MIGAQPLEQSTYASYGDVISVRSDVEPSSANMGTAQRYNFLSQVVNLRGDHAQLNLSVYRCNPLIETRGSGGGAQFGVKLLERHAHSTQVFVPMGGVAGGAVRYLVVVALGRAGEREGEEGVPDLSTLRAFIARGDQGITYKPGVWHHPLIAIDAITDFACWVYEDGTDEDCDVANLETSQHIEITV